MLDWIEEHQLCRTYDGAAGNRVDFQAIIQRLEELTLFERLKLATSKRGFDIIAQNDHQIVIQNEAKGIKAILPLSGKDWRTRALVELNCALDFAKGFQPKAQKADSAEKENPVYAKILDYILERGKIVALENDRDFTHKLVIDHPVSGEQRTQHFSMTDGLENLSPQTLQGLLNTLHKADTEAFEKLQNRLKQMRFKITPRPDGQLNVVHPLLGEDFKIILPNLSQLQRFRICASPDLSNEERDAIKQQHAKAFEKIQDAYQKMLKLHDICSRFEQQPKRLRELLSPLAQDLMNVKISHLNGFKDGTSVSEYSVPQKWKLEMKSMLVGSNQSYDRIYKPDDFEKLLQNIREAEMNPHSVRLQIDTDRNARIQQGFRPLSAVEVARSITGSQERSQPSVLFFPQGRKPTGP